MVNTTILVLAIQQGRFVGFRRTPARFAVSLRLNQQCPRVVFSASSSPTPDRRLTSSPRQQPHNVSAATRRNCFHDAGSVAGSCLGGCSFVFQQVDRNKRRRSFASKSNSNIHNTDQGRRKDGQRPPLNRQQCDEPTVSDILEN